MPQLSIITINLNNANGLEKTIQSITHQILNDFEYILIDGGSKDGSIDVIKKYEDAITHWLSEPDTGIYNAMNKGIKKASGEYCLFLNSGDCFFDNNALAGFAEAGLYRDIIYGNCAFQLHKNVKIQKFPAELTFYWLFSQYLPHSSTLIRRTLFKRIGLYNEGLKIVSDWEFFLLAIGKYNASTCYVDKVISTVEGGGLSSAFEYRELVENERMKVMQDHFPYIYPDYIRLHNYKQNSLFKRFIRIIRKFTGWRRMN